MNTNVRLTGIVSLIRSNFLYVSLSPCSLALLFWSTRMVWLRETHSWEFTKVLVLQTWINPVSKAMKLEKWYSQSNDSLQSDYNWNSIKPIFFFFNTDKNYLIFLFPFQNTIKNLCLTKKNLCNTVFFCFTNSIISYFHTNFFIIIIHY